MIKQTILICLLRRLVIRIFFRFLAFIGVSYNTVGLIGGNEIAKILGAILVVLGCSFGVAR